MAWIHRVSSERFFPFHVSVPGEDPPSGEVLFSHPDVDEDVVLADDTAWQHVSVAPEGAVLGREITHRSDIRPTAAGLAKTEGSFEVLRHLVAAAAGAKR